MPARRRGGVPARAPARRVAAPGATLVAAARWVVALGDGLELPLPGAAAVAGDVALAYTLYARTGVGAREPVVVVGADPIARFLVGSCAPGARRRRSSSIRRTRRGPTG